MFFAADRYPELNGKGADEKKQAVRGFFRSCPRAKLWMAIPVVLFLAGAVPSLWLADKLISGTSLEEYSAGLLTLAGAAFGGLVYVLVVPLLVSGPIRKLFVAYWANRRDS